MNENDFQQSLGDLITQIDSMPADQKQRLNALADEARDRHAKMKKTVADLQDSMDYLRLSIKYLLFDLEATRRENAYLRKLLEKQTNPGADAQAGEGETDPNGGE
jgi:peptidoglycan hydrolase CwlO-like protein